MRLSLLSLCAFFVFTAHAQINFPFDFETAETTPVLVDFEQAVSSVVPNPNPNDNNPSATVAKMVRQPGGEMWAGSIVTLPAYLDLSEIGAIRMKVHAPLTGSVMKMKLEGLAVSELDAITTVSNDWQELEWDFTGLPSGVFNQLAFMLDFGLYGDGTDLSTFYFDDVELFDGAGELIQVDLPITHEDENVHYQTTSFAGNFSGLSVDPTDETNKVTKVTKHYLALDYAGTTVSTPLGLSSPIPLESGYTTISVDVYSPTAGLPVRLKAEEYMDMSHSVETQVNTTTSYEWETLTFDLSQPVPGTQALNLNFDYRILSIFFDFGNPGFMSGSVDYYYDNVVHNGNPSSITETGGSTNWLYPSAIISGGFVNVAAEAGNFERFRIYTALGQVVYDGWINGTTRIALADMAPGVYVCKLGEEQPLTQKITVVSQR